MLNMEYDIDLLYFNKLNVKNVISYEWGWPKLITINYLHEEIIINIFTQMPVG